MRSSFSIQPFRRGPPTFVPIGHPAGQVLKLREDEALQPVRSESCHLTSEQESLTISCRRARASSNRQPLLWSGSIQPEKEQPGGRS